MDRGEMKHVQTRTYPLHPLAQQAYSRPRKTPNLFLIIFLIIFLICYTHPLPGAGREQNSLVVMNDLDAKHTHPSTLHPLTKPSGGPVSASLNNKRPHCRLVLKKRLILALRPFNRCTASAILVPSQSCEPKAYES